LPTWGQGQKGNRWIGFRITTGTTNLEIAAGLLARSKRRTGEDKIPAFITAPFPIGNARPSLLPNLPGYSFGGFNLTNNPSTRMSIQNVAITSNVATLYVTILEGLKPTTSQTISVQGTQTVTSGGGSNFNVTNAAITGVTIDSTTGVGTITFALSSSDIAKTVDSGLAVSPVAETADAATSTSKGLQFALSGGNSTVHNDRVVSWSYTFPSAPVSATINLQGAAVDLEANYTTLDTQGTIVAAGETRTLSIPASVNFVRCTISALSGGTNPTVIARIMD